MYIVKNGPEMGTQVWPAVKVYGNGRYPNNPRPHLAAHFTPQLPTPIFGLIRPARVGGLMMLLKLPANLP